MPSRHLHPGLIAAETILNETARYPSSPAITVPAGSARAWPPEVPPRFNGRCCRARPVCHPVLFHAGECQRSTSTATVQWRSDDLESQSGGPRSTSWPALMVGAAGSEPATQLV